MRSTRDTTLGRHGLAQTTGAHSWNRGRGAVALACTALALLAPASAHALTNFTTGSTTGWTSVLPANAAQFDYLLDQQTGAKSGDVVGTPSFPAFYVQFDGTNLAFRVRINDQDSNNATLKFNNFGFVGLDANQDGGIDVFIGAYNPTGNNGRVAVYSSDPGALNTGPSSTGIGGATLWEVAPPADGTDYSLVAVGDSSGLSGDADYFISWSVAFSQLQTQLAARGISGVTTSTPLRYIVGTAQQDNSFNVDIGGLNGIDAQDVRTWSELGAFSPYVTASGSIVASLSGPVNNLDVTQSTPVNTPRVFTSSTSSQGITVVDPDSATLAVTITVANGTFSLSGTLGLSFTTGDGLGDTTMAFSGSQPAINAALNGSSFTPTNGFLGTATLQITTTDGSGTDADTMYIRVPATSDSTAPTLTSSNPADNATGVPVGQNLVLTFSENIARGTSGSIKLHTGAGVVVETFNVATGLGDQGGTLAFPTTPPGATITLDPANALLAASSYYLTITPSALTDLAGNPFAGISSATALDFTTGAPDTTAPTLVSSNPADDATGVATGTNVTLTFDEAVQAGSGTIELRDGSGLVESFDVATGLGSNGGTVSFGGSTVTLDPGTALAGTTAYHVLVAATAVEDLSGNPFAGIAAATTVNFTTGASDTTAPTLVSSSPADDTTGVALASNIQLTFSEPVQAGTGLIQLRDASGLVESFDVATGVGSNGGTVSFSGATVTLDPGTPLSSLTQYHVLVSATAVEDLADTPFAGIASATTLDFTTLDTAPPALDPTPLPTTSGTPTGSNLTVEFDEPVLAGTGTISLVGPGGTVIETFDVTTGLGSSGGTITFNGSSFTLDPAIDLAQGSTYGITIGAGAIEDAAGNAFPGVSDPAALSFRTNWFPAPAPDAVNASADGSVGFNVLGNDGDNDGDQLTLVAFTDGAHGRVVCSASGACTYTPVAGFVGVDSFTYTVSDGKGGTATATVSVTIAATIGSPTTVAGTEFLIRIHFRIRDDLAARLCRSGCPAEVSIMTRSGPRVFAAASRPIVLGGKKRVVLRSGSRQRIDLRISVAKLKKSPFVVVQHGRMRQTQTRTRVVLITKQGRIVAYQDGQIRVSVKRLASGNLPGQRRLPAV